MTYELAVFDMAGTTVDGTFAVHDALIAAFRNQHFKIDRKIANQSVAIPKPMGIRSILKTEFNLDSPYLAKQIHEDFLLFINRFYKKDPSVKAMDGAENLFRWLHNQGIQVYLDTGFSRVTADIIIKRFEWQRKGLINGSICSDEVNHGRPAPDMIERAMALAQVTEAEKVIKIGDSLDDVKQGKNASCGLIIAMSSGTSNENELSAEKPDHLITHLAEIPKLIHEKTSIGV